MDHTGRPFAFRLAKAVRYLRLYGPSRTATKIASQYHMKRTYRSLPAERGGAHGHVGLIGCGNFAFSTIAYFLDRAYPGSIRAAMDLDLARAASLAQRYGLAYYSDAAVRILEDDRIDLVYVASNHASHAEYAIEAIRQGKHVHIEKPHVVSWDQLRRLCSATLKNRARVALGFNRPNSPLGSKAKAYLDTQTGPTMLSWFVAGHAIERAHWYYNQQEGGRVLGNLCHWTDFVYQLLPVEARYPITIRPTRSDRSDANIAVTYEFGDGSIAVIAFSEKEDPFEGVHERLSAHRGAILLTLDNFDSMTVHIGERRLRHRSLFRDHGHRATVLSSYAMTRGPSRSSDETARYLWETGELFLATKEALESDRPVEVTPFAEAKLALATAEADATQSETTASARPRLGARNDRP